MNAPAIKRVWWIACAAIYTAFFAFYSYDAWKRPTYNWDMIAYWGVIESYHSTEPKEIYARTMAHVKELYSPLGYKRITVENKHSNSAEAFIQHLPFYTIKPLYPLLMYGLYKQGMDLPHAAVTLSVVGFIFIGIACFLLRPEGLDRGIWWLAVVGFSLIGKLSLVVEAKVQTPDMLCIALCLLGLYAWMEKRWAGVMGLCFLIAQLLRPDTIVWILCVCALFAFSPAAIQKLPRAKAGFIVLLSAILYVLANRLGGGNWPVLFSFTFLNNTGFPFTDKVDFGIAEVVRVIANNFVLFVQEGQVLSLICVTACTLLAYFSNPGGKRFAFHMLLIAWASLLIRFVAFPAYWEARYYYANYFLILLAALEIMAPYFPAGKRIETKA